MCTQCLISTEIQFDAMILDFLSMALATFASLVSMKFVVRAGQSTGSKSDSTFSKATLTPFRLRLWPPYLSIAGIQCLRSLLVRSMPLRGQVFYRRYCIGCTGLCSMTLHRNRALSVIPVIIKMLKNITHYLKRKCPKLAIMSSKW